MQHIDILIQIIGKQFGHIRQVHPRIIQKKMTTANQKVAVSQLLC
jgi:hypothetical protein